MQNDINNIQRELTRGAVAYVVDHRGLTALMLAAQNGHVEIVHLFLDRGAVVDVVDHRGQTALMLAAQNGHMEIVHLLLDRGAVVNAVDHRGRTAQMLAAQNGHMEIVHLLLDRGAQVDDPLPQGMPAAIHGTQSTHTASVHQTASVSAKRLHDRYAGKMSHETLDTMKMEMDALIGSLQNEAAKRCIKRLAALETPFTDPISGVTLHDLLALSWLAIHDDTMRLGTLEDAITLYMEGLYEIQRGYNISTGRDSGEEDRPICLAGTFNKLLEKLQGVHPDVEILFITKSLASLKLPIVVQEEAIKYLREQANQSILCAVKEDGVQIIWKDIQGKVSQRMFDEFGSLYANEEDVDFDALIKNGKDVAFSEEELQEAFPDFQEENNGNGGAKPSVCMLM